MTRMANLIWERLQTMIVQQLGVCETEVVPTADFIEDFGADTLDLRELIMAIEEEYDITISGEDATKLSTVGDILEYLIKVVG